MSGVSGRDWIVVGLLVLAPLLTLWAYVELDAWRRRRRSRARRHARRGYLFREDDHWQDVPAIADPAEAPDWWPGKPSEPEWSTFPMMRDREP